MCVLLSPPPSKSADSPTGLSNTALDAGFATAAPIRIKWIRDLASMIFSGFYLGFADQADEKLRKFRAVPTVRLADCSVDDRLSLMPARSGGVDAGDLGEDPESVHPILHAP